MFYSITSQASGNYDISKKSFDGSYNFVESIPVSPDTAIFAFDPTYGYTVDVGQFFNTYPDCDGFFVIVFDTTYDFDGFVNFTGFIEFNFDDTKPHIFFRSTDSMASFFGITSGSVDLAPVMTRLDDVASLVSNLYPAFTDTFTKLDLIQSYTDTLETTVSAVQTAVSDLLPLQSLNGNGSEFIDGIDVTVSGRTTVYTVIRSFFSVYADNGYTVHYDLESLDGHKLTAPEALLTVHTVIAP